MVAVVCRLAALAVFLGFAGAAAAQVEHNTNRPGGDLTSFDLTFRDPEPEDCAQACEDHGGCESWTYVHAGVQGPNPRCWLKKGRPAPVSDNCCDSGVRTIIGWGAGLDTMGGTAVDTNLPGGDYRHFPVGSNGECEDACRSEAECRAWTYVHPGVQDPSGQCWLKSSVPAPVTSGCCISGVTKPR